VRRAHVAVLVAAAAVAVAGCGVPDSSRPEVIQERDVPFQLLAPTASVTSTTKPGSVATARATIYLIDADGRLVSADREVERPATVVRAVEALLLGPTEDETGRLSTSITSGTQLLDVDGPSDGLVTVDLSEELLDITGRQQILALAQVVYTVTALPNVERVLFRIDGERREVPNGDGKLTSSPLGRGSYRALVTG